MKVRLLVSIQGTRDGIAWPPKGEVIDLPTSEAEHMVAVGQAAAVESAKAEPAVESAAVDTKPAARRAPRKS